MSNEGKSVILGFDERAETVVQGLGTILAVSYFDTSEAIDLIADLLTEIDRLRRVFTAEEELQEARLVRMLKAEYALRQWWKDPDDPPTYAAEIGNTP